MTRVLEEFLVLCMIHKQFFQAQCNTPERRLSGSCLMHDEEQDEYA